MGELRLRLRCSESGRRLHVGGYTWFSGRRQAQRPHRPIEPRLLRWPPYVFVDTLLASADTRKNASTRSQCPQVAPTSKG